VIKKDKSLPFIIVSIAIVIILFLSQIFSDDFRIKVLDIFRIPLRIISGSYYVLRDVAGFKELRNENKILRGNVNSLEEAVFKLREVSLENERLRKLLGFRESEKHKFIPSMVIARDPLRLTDTIIIDKGKRDGVETDMVVISGEGLVGRVRECGMGIARVLLVTDHNSVVGGIVQRTRDEGAVCGISSGLFMKYLELASDIKKGDKVITSGFGGVFEKGILIGEVVSVERDSSGLYLKAIVKPEVDMSRLEEVLVMSD